jgi:hypothetical protein
LFSKEKLDPSGLRMQNHRVEVSSMSLTDQERKHELAALIHVIGRTAQAEMEELKQAHDEKKEAYLDIDMSEPSKAAAGKAKNILERASIIVRIHMRMSSVLKVIEACKEDSTGNLTPFNVGEMLATAETTNNVARSESELEKFLEGSLHVAHTGCEVAEKVTREFIEGYKNTIEKLSPGQVTCPSTSNAPVTAAEKRCRQCGEKLRDDSKFCFKCGQPLA